MDKREYAELEAELVQIRTDIESLTLQMADSMSPERLEAVLRPLREQAKRIQIQLEGSGTVVAGDHNVGTGLGQPLAYSKAYSSRGTCNYYCFSFEFRHFLISLSSLK